MTHIKVHQYLKDLIPDYLMNRKIDLDKMREALNIENFEIIYQISHKIKGSGGTYGFSDLSLLASALEDFAKKKDKVELLSKLQEMEKYLLEIEIEFEE
jgi:hypothetical protein